MEKGTKQSYDEAINSLIAKIYNDTYKVNLNELKKGSQEQSNKQSFKSFKESLKSQGIPIENEVKSFINFVEKNIYNENGVTFTQLNNALKTLNAYYKQATDPNFKSHIKNATESFLRDDIKAGIEAIFSQNKTAYKDVTSLYETALKDYANMKSTLKLVDSIKLRDIKTTHDLALDSLLKLAKGQGDELDNISTLTKALDSQNRAVIELNMLQSLFTKSLYDKDMLQVFDSGKFFDELNKLHTNTFQSKAAKDFIELAQGFHTLFKNDVLIAQSLRPTTTQAIGSSIATSIEGAVRFQFVKELFSHIIRLMPKIPFATALNEKVSGAALRYHVKSALQKSYSVSDFKNTLDSKVAKVPFDNQTRAYIEDLSKNIEKIQDELIEVAERNAKQAQNAKDLQEYQTLQKYGVESLEKLSQDDFNHFVDSVLSGDIEALKSAPNIVYIADLNAELAKELGLNNGKIFLRKNDLHHFRPERKVEYDQAVPREIIKEIPNIINNAPLAYKDPLHNNFFITKELNQVEVMKIAINKDSEGNYIITLSKVEKSSIENQGLEAVGLAPTIPNLNDEAYRTTMLPPSTSKPSDIIPQNPTKAQTQYFNSLTNEYEKIKEIKKLHTQDDVLVRVMKLNDRYIEPLSNMSVSKEYLQKQTAQSLKEQITRAILGNQTQLKALQQGYNTYHLSSFQKEILESALDIANNPTKLKEYKLQGLQKQLDNLNSNEAYHIEKGREYDKARYAKDRQELEKEIIKEGGEVLYSDLPELPIIAKPDLTAKALNSEANLSDIIPQMPKDNSDPVKTFEYFRDDLIRGYDKALETFEGKRPLVSTIPYKALDPIIEAKKALVKEANDGFKKILQKAGFPDDVIQEKFMKSLNFGDIDYNLRRIRQYFGQVEKNLHQYDEAHKPIAEKLLKQEDEAIRLYESRLPAEQELEKKRILLNSFMENARVYGSKEHKLLNNFIDEIEAKRALESTQTPPTQKGLFDEVDSSDIIFTDKKGKEHTLTKEVQEQWCETFNLKSLDESYTPKHSDDILQALGGKEIKLQLGSLKKLVAQGREKYIPQIKEVLDSPEAILKDSDNAFLFAKHLKDDDYFVNVSVDKGEYLVSISNGIKETSNIKNKVENGAEVVYQSPNANSNLQTLLQTSRYSANKIDSDIIPQTPQEIIKQAKQSGKSVAETKEYETLKEHIEIPLQKEIQQAEQELIEYEKRTGKLLDDDYKQSYIETTIRDFYRYYEIPERSKSHTKEIF